MKTITGGYCMAGGTFITVGAEKQFCLKDVEVQCYGNYEPTWNVNRWRGQCKAPNGFQLMTLDDTGHTEATYYWQYWKEGTQEAPTVTQGWFKDDGKGGYVKIEQDELDKIEVKAGQAYYVMGNGNTLNFHGPEL